MTKAKKTTSAEYIYSDEIDLRPYLKGLWKNWLLILLTTVVCVGLSFLLAKFLPPTYESKALITFQGDELRYVSSQEITRYALIGPKETQEIFNQQAGLVIKEKKQNQDSIYQDVEKVQGSIDKKDAYPLSVKFTLSNTDNYEEINQQLLSSLNQAEYTKEVVESTRKKLKDEIKFYQDEIDKLTKQINKGNDSAELYIQRVTFRQDLVQQQAAYDQVQGYVFLVQPYLLNQGKKTFPNTKLFLVIGAISGLLLGSSIAIVKEKPWQI